MHNKIIGNKAEEFVAHMLGQEGFSIIERNYRKRYGEIDIIATKKDLLIFVEVKMRTTHYFDLSQVITPTKQRKIIKTAYAYLAHHSYDNKACRFDVALIEMKNDTPYLTYIDNAFFDNEI